jgi:hypothetical protein
MRRAPAHASGRRDLMRATADQVRRAPTCGLEMRAGFRRENNAAGPNVVHQRRYPPSPYCPIRCTLRAHPGSAAAQRLPVRSCAGAASAPPLQSATVRKRNALKHTDTEIRACRRAPSPPSLAHSPKPLSPNPSPSHSTHPKVPAPPPSHQNSCNLRFSAPQSRSPDTHKIRAVGFPSYRRDIALRK